MIIKKAHTLPPEQARELARRLASKLEKEMGATSAWESDDRMRFKGKGFEGVVALTAGEVSVDVTLGFLLRALSGKIEKEVRSRLEKEFA